MAVLLETALGDLVIDLEVDGSPYLCKNFLKLVKTRQYTQNLIYHITPSMARMGCPRGDGTGGASIYAYLDSSSSKTKEQQAELSSKRFLKSTHDCRILQKPQRGDVVALTINNVPDTIGSQFGIVLQDISPNETESTDRISLGHVVEDPSNVLEQLSQAYCDPEGRPLADIRIVRAHVIYDPFGDPPGLDQLMIRRGIVFNEERTKTQPEEEGSQEPNETQNDWETRVVSSPSPGRPSTERIASRIPIQDVEEELDEAQLQQRQMEALRKEDHGRAVVLEMLGDLPSAEITAPENVLFICKLNPITQDDDLQLIFSRFDPNVKVEIIRDYETGNSLQYAFAEFTTKQQAVEAYFKMNNALVDDRRIKVDFSQSVSKLWDKYRQKLRHMPSGDGPGGTFGDNARSSQRPPEQPRHDGRRRNDHSRECERNRGRGEGHRHDDRPRSQPTYQSSSRRYEAPREDEFGRARDWDRRSNGHGRRQDDYPRNDADRSSRREDSHARHDDRRHRDEYWDNRGRHEEEVSRDRDTRRDHEDRRDRDRNGADDHNGGRHDHRAHDDTKDRYERKHDEPREWKNRDVEEERRRHRDGRDTSRHRHHSHDDAKDRDRYSEESSDGCLSREDRKHHKRRHKKHKKSDYDDDRRTKHRKSSSRRERHPDDEDRSRRGEDESHSKRSRLQHKDEKHHKRRHEHKSRKRSRSRSPS